MPSLKRAVVLQFATFLLAAIFIAWVAWHYPVVSYIVRAQQKIGAMEVWGGLLYPLLTAVGNVFLLPCGVLAIGSGLFFGLWWGLLINLAGNVSGAAIAFLISRHLGRNWVARRFLGSEKWAALDRAIARHGWKIIFLSQVHPFFPTSLLNYLYGITRIRFGTCMLWIALAQAPGLFLYAYLGTLTQLGLRVLSGKSHPAHLEYVLWIGGLVVTVVATAGLGRLAFKVLEEVKPQAEPLAEEELLELEAVER